MYECVRVCLYVRARVCVCVCVFVNRAILAGIAPGYSRLFTIFVPFLSFASLNVMTINEYKYEPNKRTLHFLAAANGLRSSRTTLQNH